MAEQTQVVKLKGMFDEEPPIGQDLSDQHKSKHIFAS